MIPKIHKQGSSTLGLLNYLYGPGKAEAHTDPHLVASFDGTAPDPGRHPDATRKDLRDLLDQPLHLLDADQRPAKHVWHCSVRAAPTDRTLTDTEWADIARRMVAATGIAPDGDDAACRWAAIRHADDHIHIIATLVREDGRRPNHHRSGKHAQAACRTIEADYDLHHVDPGDGTAARRPSSAEQRKAQRQGKQITARDQLRATVRTVAAHATSEDHFFELLAGPDLLVEQRIAPSGDVLGYKVALAGDVNAAGEPVWYAGGTLAKNLTWPKIRERINAKDTDSPAETRARDTQPDQRWRQTTRAARTAHDALHGDDPAAAQAQLAVVGDLLDILPSVTTGPTRTEVFAAAQAFERATRSRIRHEYAQAATLRSSAHRLLRTAGQPVGTAPVADLLLTLVLVALAAHRFHQAHGHAQQASAAQTALTHLQAAYQHTATPTLAELASRAPCQEIQLSYAVVVRRVLPEHAERILADPAWPALATTLTTEALGDRAGDVLAEAAGRRELATATHPAHVLIWRLRNTPTKRAQAARATSTHTGRLRAPATRRTPHDQTDATRPLPPPPPPSPGPTRRTP